MRNSLFMLRYLVVFGILISNQFSIAQIETGEMPISFDFPEIQNIVAPLITVEMPFFEEEEETNEKKGRYGIPIDISIDFLNQAQRSELPDGGTIWRLRIASADAGYINLYFSNFYLPKGGKLFAYGEVNVRGAFTDANNKEGNKFALGRVYGDEITLEYFQPANVDEPAALELFRIVHAYNKSGSDYGTAGPCHITMHCKTPYDPHEAVATIEFAGGGDCSGALLNQNVDQDKISPFFLTANHCTSGEQNELAIFYFNFQSPICYLLPGPTNYSISGAWKLADAYKSDFSLLEFMEPIPPHYDVFYAGWDSRGTSNKPTHTASIHHPKGDTKKWSYDHHQPIPDSRFGLPLFPNSFWKIDNWEDGVTEGGSSGGPLFDQNGRVVGQLLGGYSDCDNHGASDWYGKMSWSYNSDPDPTDRLIDRLDPGWTGITHMNGRKKCWEYLYYQGHTIHGASTYRTNNFRKIEVVNFMEIGHPAKPLNFAATSQTELVAGDKIVFKPNSWILPGAELWAHIGPVTACDKWSPPSPKLESPVVEKVNHLNIRAIPNPTDGLITVQALNDWTGQIQILDLYGRLIVERSGNFSDREEFDLTQLSQGTYIVKAICENEQFIERIIHK